MTSVFAALSMLVLAHADVVVSRRVDISAAHAELVARDVSRALAAAKMDDVRAPDETLALLKKLGAGDPTACDARRPCVTQLGLTLESGVIVSIDLGEVGNRLALSLMAIDPARGALLLKAAFTVPLNRGEVELARGLDTFAGQLSGMVEKKKPVIVAQDAPLEQPLVPPPEVHVVKTPMGAKVAAGGAVVTAGTAIVFGILGGVAASSLSSAEYESASGPASRLTRSEADALASSANTHLAVAGACLAASAVLTGIAIYLWQ